MSSGDPRDVRLPERAEALLKDWPAPAKTEEYWEERAVLVVAALGKAPPAAAPLDAPLPAEPSESKPADFVRAAVSAPIASKSLAALAREVRDAKQDDNLVDIARESLSLAAQRRTTASDVAARIRAANVTEQPPPSASSSSDGSPSAPESGKVRPQRSLAPITAVAIGVLSLAAGALLLIRTHGERAEATAALAPSPPTATPTAAVATPSPAESGVVALEDLPNGAQPSPPEAARQARTGASGEHAAAPHEKKPGADKNERVEVAEQAAPKGAPTGATPAQPPEKLEPPLGPALGDTNLPLEPSQGDALAALAAVTPSAQACIAGQEAPSTAVITFGSDGRVKNVMVSGGSANTPSAACIRSALGKAHVHRFAKDSFTVTKTIRPP